MRVCVGFFLGIFLVAAGVRAEAGPLDDLKTEVERLRGELNKQEQSNAKLSPISRVDGSLENKYGPNAKITTRSGKLEIGGLIQVWYQSIQNDHIGLVRAAPGNNLGNDGLPLEEPNEVLDNDTFRVRRTELHFGMDIHENIFGFILIDPARENNVTFTPIPTFPNHNGIFDNPNLAQGRGLQAGNSIRPQLLQDAYINVHDLVPHHDFTVGQFIPPSGEEAWRSSGQLEFVDRAMCTAINKVRDIGAMAHGTWFSGRLQYWVGVFNGPEGTVLTDPEIQEGGNRSDDNDAKDIAWRIAGRPVWDKDKWHGRLEVGYARTDGYRGESGQAFDPTTPVNGINEKETKINRQAAWVWYRPGDKVRGWWLRGEWSSGRDRYSRSARTDLLGTGGSVIVQGDNDIVAVLGQLNPAPVTVSGWYFGTGYKMSDTIWAEDLKGGGMCKSILHDMEFAFRYESFQNVATEDLVSPDTHTDLFKTQAYTAGVNYYLKGHDMKVQANYIWVDDPDSAIRGIQEVKNNVFVLSFQVMF